ncbi:MAG: hypothetical protein KGH94_04975 [Candidatus Micrarchaeota archaeon]|nr:hypothetical protein [Candidatus Micrarchaeota archaeon]
MTSLTETSFVKRGWTPHPGEAERREREGQLSRLAMGNQWIRMPESPRPKFPIITDTTKISKHFNASIPENLKTARYKVQPKISFEVEPTGTVITMSVPVPLNTPDAERFLDKMAEQIILGIGTGKLLRNK